MDSDLVTT